MKKNFWFVCILGSFLFGFSSCVDSLKSDIEEANFLMDEGKFSEAVTKARSAVAQDPTNIEANYVLAVALLSDGMLSSRPGCAETDDGFFGLIACLQDDPGSNETPFTTFAKISPAADKISGIEEARDLLIGLTSQISSSTQLSTTYLQLYFARLFEISGAVTRIGATSPNELCNSNHLSPTKDLVPDDFNANALTDSQKTRFNENLSNLGSDGQKAGLSSDFGLTNRVTEIQASIDTFTILADFFTDQFSDAEKAACTVSK